MYVLIDLGVTYFFVARKIKNELKKKRLKLKKKRFLISTPLGDAVTIKHVYMEVKIPIRDMMQN